MGKVGIIKERGVEEIVFEEDMPKLIFGLSNSSAQKKERKSIGCALVKTGLEVYATDTLWPNDSYVSNNGLAIAERYFGDLAHGGNYIFGDGFVLVSSAIKDNLEEKLKDYENFREFFSGSEVIFVPPYSRNIKGIEGSKVRPRHIDVTANYVPGAKLLSVARAHYSQEKELFEELREKFPLSPYSILAELRLGDSHYFKEEYIEAIKYNSNNFYSLNKMGVCYSILGKYNDSIRIFNHILQSDPNYEDAFYNLAIVYYNKGSYQNSLMMFKKLEVNTHNEKRKIEIQKWIKLIPSKI